MTTVLVTGYEPFSTFDRNPSALVAEGLDGTTVSGATVVGRVLPVDLRAMPGALRDLLERHRPAVVLSLGLAAGIAGVNVERVGVNLADLSRTPDNAGCAVSDAPLAPGGPDALFATVPTRRIVERLHEEGIPAALSYSAGAHLCNAILYQLLCGAREHGFVYRAGFLHLPLLPEMAVLQPQAASSMSLDTMRRAIEIAVAVSLPH